VKAIKILILLAVIAIALSSAAQTKPKTHTLNLKTVRQDEILVIGIQRVPVPQKKCPDKPLLAGSGDRQIQSAGWNGSIPTGKYAVLQSDKGLAWEVIPAAWQKVSDAEDKGARLRPHLRC
jgi:hypothetical protein